MAIPQGRHGYVSIGGVKYPVFNWQMPNPRNLIAPQPMGNSWSTSFAEGLKTSRFTASMMVREKTGEILSAAKTFFNLFLARTWTGGFDDTAATTIIAHNGLKSYTLANAKAEAFTLTIAKGMMVGLSVVFVAPGIPTIADSLPADYSNTIDNSPPLMFDKVTFGGITGNIYGAEITYSNNHQPNGPLDGTKTLASYDAGSPSAGASFTFASRQIASEPFADGATITVALAGGSTNTLSLTKVVPNNPYDGNANIGQSFVTYNCLIQGDTVNKPITIS